MQYRYYVMRPGRPDNRFYFDNFGLCVSMDIRKVTPMKRLDAFELLRRVKAYFSNDNFYVVVFDPDDMSDCPDVHEVVIDIISQAQKQKESK